MGRGPCLEGPRVPPSLFAPGLPETPTSHDLSASREEPAIEASRKNCPPSTQPRAPPCRGRSPEARAEFLAMLRVAPARGRSGRGCRSGPFCRVLRAGRPGERSSKKEDSGRLSPSFPCSIPKRLSFLIEKKKKKCVTQSAVKYFKSPNLAIYRGGVEVRVLIAKDLAAPAFCTFAEIAFSRVMQAARRAKFHAERAALGSA